ncbi:hypothetical protein NMY22_g8466 [Coprinellus aureogranulatus]|nr:hypothetical protein NMY22_g8466 [Coprinellus aureogranulatus]
MASSTEQPFSVAYGVHRWASDLSLGIVAHGPPGTPPTQASWSILVQHPETQGSKPCGSMYTLSHRQLTKQSASTIVKTSWTTYPYAIHHVTWLDLSLEKGRVFEESRSPVGDQKEVKEDFPFGEGHTIIAYKQIITAIPPFDLNGYRVDAKWLEGKVAGAMPVPVSRDPEDKPTPAYFRQLTREWALRSCLDIEKGLKSPKDDTLTKMESGESSTKETPYGFVARKLEKDARRGMKREGRSESPSDSDATLAM